MNHRDTETQRLNELSARIIGFAMDIHRALGPGLLESAYDECLAFEFARANFQFERQKPLPLVYKGVRLDCGYRLDFVVEDVIVVEIKAVTDLIPLHEAQLLTYLKLTGLPLGLLINFNVPMLKQGVKRLAARQLLKDPEPQRREFRI